MRISVTELDAYRYYRDNEDAELEQLLNRLRRLEPPTREMEAGKAFHKLLERAVPGELAFVHDGDFCFDFRQLDAAIMLPPVRELKGEMRVSTSVGPVVLVGVVDAMDQAVHDYKLTERFDAEKYADSYQWRCYLTMFGAQKFIYDVFVAHEDLEMGQHVVYEYHALPLYAYPQMREDVAREVSEFVEFVHKYLPERRSDATRTEAQATA
jgi:hypothetical protein